VKENGTVTDVLTKRPKCDLCGEPAAVDGATIHGPWAYMCPGHFHILGVGLGEGRGQIIEVAGERLPL
jgi:hypothetical protein